MNIECGIPDIYISCFIKAVFVPLTFAISQLPVTVLFQKLCPEGVEATMMALNASILNLRVSLGALTGVLTN